MNAKPEDLSPSSQAAHPTDGQLPIAPPSKLRWIFFGADGIRAGWGLLIFVALLSAIVLPLEALVNKYYLPTHPRPSENLQRLWETLISQALDFLIFFFATWVMSKIERRPNSVYGLGGNRRLPHFVAGLAWGVASLTLLVLILWKTGLLVIDSRLLSGSGILRYGALWLLGFVFVGLWEEYGYKGYAQYTLTRGLEGFYRKVFKTRHSVALSFWTSAVAISVFFGYGHGSNPGESPIGLLTVFLVAMVLYLSLWRTGSLWWAIGFHAAWDWSESFLYGVADSGWVAEHHLLATHPVGKTILSGGATGPEGSIYIVVVMALAGLGVFFTIPDTAEGYASKFPSHGLAPR